MALFRGTLWLCVCVYAIAKRLNNLIIVGTCERLIRKLVLVTTEVTIIIVIIIIIMWKQQQQQHKPHERHLSLRIEYEDGREEDDEINPFVYVANPKTPYCLFRGDVARKVQVSDVVLYLRHGPQQQQKEAIQLADNDPIEDALSSGDCLVAKNAAPHEPKEEGRQEQGQERYDFATPSKQPSLEPPKELVCPITLELMEDPVMTADGQTYERSAIEHVFGYTPTNRNPASPATGVVLPSRNLVPNVAIRSLCREFSDKNKQP